MGIGCVYPHRGAMATEYRENKPLFTCLTRQHLLAPRPCPHGACRSAAPACQCWLLGRPPGWPPASRAAPHAGSKLRPAAAKTGANGWELWQWGWHAVTVDNALHDGGDDAQRPLLAKRAARHIQRKDALQQPRPTPAR